MFNIKEFYERLYLFLERDRVERMKHSFRLEVMSEFLQRYQDCNRKILFVGCGSGEETNLIPAKAVAFDLSSAAVAMARKDFPKNMYLLADATYLPFANQSFDCIVCSEVLEHLPFPQKTLVEFSRVLRPKGELIMTIPNWLSLYGLFRLAGESLLGRPLTSAGQPIDNWYTKKSLQRQVGHFFWLIEERGIWYYPPTGKGRYVLPDCITAPIFALLHRLDSFLGKVSPTLGSHMLAVRCIKK